MSLLLEFFTSKFGRLVLIVLMIICVVLLWDYNERQLGAKKLQNAINQQNERAMTNADQAEHYVRDCYASGGVYDGNAGKCEH